MCSGCSQGKRVQPSWEKELLVKETLVCEGEIGYINERGRGGGGRGTSTEFPSIVVQDKVALVLLAIKFKGDFLLLPYPGGHCSV